MRRSASPARRTEIQPTQGTVEQDAMSRGTISRCLLLIIVRNCVLDWLKNTRSGQQLFQLGPADLDWTGQPHVPRRCCWTGVGIGTPGTWSAEYREMLIQHGQPGPARSCRALRAAVGGASDQVSENKSPNSPVFSLQDSPKFPGAGEPCHV
jgi:hypothetical protein